MREIFHGHLHKMRTDPGPPVHYRLVDEATELALNPLLGRRLALRFTGRIHCIHCGRLTKKSFSQGYCYPCFRKLAECDMCITRPETCHYHLGTCREPAWGEENCFRDHIVYLANASGIKVGITRQSQVPVRWIDQGAVAAIPMYRVRDRRTAGFLEVAIKAHVSDRTNWRAMLQGEPEAIDLVAWRDRLLGECRHDAEQLRGEFGLDAVTELPDSERWDFAFPVQQYPAKVQSLNPDKHPQIGGILWGIKGQYLIFDRGVINVRTYAGYELGIDCD